MGIRVAINENVARAYIDREVTVFESTLSVRADPYALKKSFPGVLCLRDAPIFSKTTTRISALA